MISFIQASSLGLLQGLTELFPISSLGHSVILPPLLHWQLNEKDPFFLTFLVGTHVATALVLFLFFLADWRRLIAGFFRSLKNRTLAGDNDAKLIWLIIVGTIPAGLLGLMFEKPLGTLFASPKAAAAFLILNGLMFLGGEYLRRRQAKTTPTTIDSDSRLAQLSFKQSAIIGTMQSIALFPGFSRTGASIVGGLIAGLSHEDSARFSFLLATPIIAAAGLLKLPHLFSAAGRQFLFPTFIGAICAAAAAWFAVTFLTKYFKTKTLVPFAIYCLTLGIFASLYLGF
jgi:undecaprenyl-diphosphatase